MSWKAKRHDDASVTWAGTDVLFNPYFRRRRTPYILVLCVVGFIVLGLYGAATVGLTRIVGPMLGSLLSWGIFFGGLWWLWKFDILGRILPDQWIRRSWTLQGNPSGFHYAAGPFVPYHDADQFGPERWSVSIDDVARAQAGLMGEWQGVRSYEGAPILANDQSTGIVFSSGVLQVPEREFHTFLFLNDASRRVIYIANADPESTGMLVQSINGWLHEMRSKAPAAIEAKAETRGYGGKEGFDF